MAISINKNEDRKSYEKVGLIYNAMNNYEKEVFFKRLLQEEGDINYTISEGSVRVPNLLHDAMPCGQKYFKLLLEHGADITKKDEEGRTAVHAAVRNEAERSPHSRESFDVYINLVLAVQVKSNDPSNPSDKNGITHLHAACMTNNAAAVELFLNNGANINQAVNVDFPYFSGCTPLHIALAYDSVEVFEILLSRGANVHLKNSAGLSTILRIIKIVEKKIKNSTLDENNEKTLGVFAKFFINDNATSIDATADYGFCKFHIAAILDNESLIESVLERISNINQAVNFDSPFCPGYTALHFAAFSKMQIFNLLWKNGADIDIKNAKGETPFDLCLRKFWFGDIHFIISTKTEWKKIVLSDEKTKLTDVISAMPNPEEFVSFLNSNQSTLFVPFDSPLWPGYTMLHLAVILTSETPMPDDDYDRRIWDKTKVDECLKRGADVTVENANGSTALHLAFYQQKLYIVHYLLDYHEKADNPADKDNLSHFHIACAAGHQKTVERFLTNGVDVNSQINSSTFEWNKFFIVPGSTALHINVANGKKQITIMLLKHGADVNAQDANDFTPIHRLLSSYYNDLDGVLLSMKNLKNITTPCGLGHLHIACRYGNKSAVEKLLKLGADINAPVNCNGDVNLNTCNNLRENQFRSDSYGDPQGPLGFLSKYAGYTPLHFASVNNFDCLQLLIEKNADVFSQDRKGICPLQTLLQRRDDGFIAIISKNVGIQRCMEETYGITKLHVACHLVDVKLVEHSIKHGANVNAKINSGFPIWQGYTPLHCAMKRAFKKSRDKSLMEKFSKIIKLLTKHGADVFSTDENGDTPFHLIKHLYNSYNSECRCSLSIYSPLLSVLLGHVENFNDNPTDNQGLSLLHIAILVGNADIIERFLKHTVDVNQAISYFSKCHPGSTPLQLLVKCHRHSKGGFSDEIFLRIIDTLLELGVNVNAVDATGSTPLIEAIRLPKLRGILMKRFLSNGSDLDATNVHGNETFEDIELFLRYGNFNTYNPVNQEGHLAIFLRYYDRIRCSPEILKNQLVLGIMDNPKVFEIDHSGRTTIHNVVSIDSYVNENPFERKFRPVAKANLPLHQKLLYAARRTFGLELGISWYAREITDDDRPYELESEIIKQLSIRDCDIDHQDDEGKTALHYAVIFVNSKAVIQLLKNGADINIIDKSGKTAFAYCCEPLSDYYSWDHDRNIDGDKNYANKILATHVYKLEFCKQRVDKQNQRLQVEVLQNLGPMKSRALDGFHEEMDKAKSVKIGNTSFSLYEFLTNTDTDFNCSDMTSEELREVDQFFENKHNFLEIEGLLKWKYRKTIERTKLMGPALASLSILTYYQLPEVCCRIIFRFLTNADMKRLIASVP